MNAHSESQTTGLGIFFQIIGALLVIAIVAISVVVLAHFVTAAVANLLPLLVIGAVVYVLVKLITDAGSSD